MKVYCLINRYAFEGDELVEIHADKDLAYAREKEMNQKYGPHSEDHCYLVEEHDVITSYDQGDEKSTILPCPFCGGEAKVFETGQYTAHYAVCCAECECRTHEQDTEEEAIRIWNRRVIE